VPTVLDDGLTDVGPEPPGKVLAKRDLARGCGRTTVRDARLRSRRAIVEVGVEQRGPRGSPVADEQCRGDGKCRNAGASRHARSGAAGARRRVLGGLAERIVAVDA
jgi:hypothetical protein